MRKDIEIHINTGDITLGVVDGGTKYPFDWVTNTDGGEDSVYGEVTVPSTISFDSITSNGISCDIPYIGKTGKFYVRFRRKFTEDYSMYMQNSKDGSEWFIVKATAADGTISQAVPSQLRLISRRGYDMHVADGECFIYAYGISDFNIVDAKVQNTNTMLACLPTNNYRFPTTGVGLIRWKDSRMLSAGLSEVLEREFGDDGTPVISASYDFETNKLDLNIDTTNA